MNIFVVNCGSSSIKYQLFDMADESVRAKGVVERVGSDEALLTHTVGGQKHTRTIVARNHTEGMKYILALLVEPGIGVLASTDEIDAVGHRVVHGGKQMSRTCLIDQGVIDIIRENFVLGPLHNPPNLMGIEAAMTVMPGTPNVAVFDTAFLATLPPKAYRYAVPAEWYTRHHVRRYGFHGTSHRYVSVQTAALLGKPVEQLNVITAHLGNGCSMTAIANGQAVDHSMGMTPLEGLVMGTRSGDIDPAVVFYMTSVGLPPGEVDKALNKSSGLLGLSEFSNDMRDLLTAVEGGNEKARLAVECFVYRIVKYIGAYSTILPSLDAVVFTGGIGENSTPVRGMVVEGLSRLGAKLDVQRNDATLRGVCGPITTPDSALPVWVVPTNEELMIARDTETIVKAL
ncbi:MAG: acetate kinase [Phycisphaerae bacterium]|nr:acetate kinase [Phycisphaerae bacterium]